MRTAIYRGSGWGGHRVSVGGGRSGQEWKDTWRSRQYNQSSFSNLTYHGRFSAKWDRMSELAVTSAHSACVSCRQWGNM